ncbi:MAG: DNA polymerase III subunit gamma/tau [Candidatus Pacebacteria bacterium]|nr:DNA polymerase III subunit gamma/tau [Candidatus Paceibacterota bacterium]
MSDTHTVLYRKYRPQNFDEVYGQDQVVKVLKGSLETGKIGHAYLFSGVRGTGKTTMARIFARALGCSDNDIIEIDAASNRGIDDIRALREGVNSLPFDSEKKMYIIDEVHMLTKEAFNALLKTLEEPPSHVIFVLATTEFHKVLPTIISRCQSFIFKSPTYSVLKEMINDIVTKEGYTIDAGSLDIIAMLGNGSFRDTQGVLQKLMSYSTDTNITRDETELVTGSPSAQMIHDLLIAVNEQDSDTALKTLHGAQESNIDPHIFMQMLTHAVRSVLQIRFSSHMADTLKEDLGEDEFNFLKSIASEKNNIHSAFLELLLKTYAQMNSAYLKYAPIELAILKSIGNNN